MKKNKTLFQKHILGQISLICMLVIWPINTVLSQKYFQQEVHYQIQATLDDKLHELNAFESIEYINQSPDTLKFVFFHLWPNAYLNNNTSLAGQLFSVKGKMRLFNDPDLKGFIDSLDFKIENEHVEWALLPGQPDVCKILFNRPLKPGETIHITTPFHVKIPKGVTSRMGHIGESYQISQWYPKPAVYDRSGWHEMSYLDQGEFYSEFGSYDVSITLPSNYIVGATGELQNKSEQEMLDALAADTSWKTSLDTAGTIFPKSSVQMKTLRYTENRIHDFAWFADKRFHVLKGKVELPKSGKEVTTWLMFTNRQAKLWKDAIPYANNAISLFSKWNGEYPYKNFTVIQSALNAGIGMEYPGITVIGFIEDAYALDRVIAHEIGHSWFYGMLASNERRYPFMDEGMTSALEVRYMMERYPDKKLWEVYLQNKKMSKFLHIEKIPAQRMQELEWLIPARSNEEQPLNLTSTDYSPSNYGLMIYDKTAIGFSYLRAYLGDSLYDSTIQDYFQQWKYKHPQPEDLRYSFESQTRKNLDWFFTDFLSTTKRLDYEVVRLEGQKVLVRNKGELVAPLVVSGVKGDSVYFEKWVDGFQGEKWIDLPEGNYSEVKIDPNHKMPELFRLNNNIRRSGLFPKADALKTQLLFSIDNPDKRTVTYIPVANWTKDDGFMVGMAFHNGFLLPKPLEYYFVPFYTFRNPGLAGFGKIAYHLTPYNMFLQKATFSLEGVQFGAPGNQQYQKVKAGVELNFRPRSMNDPLLQKAFAYYIVASDLLQIDLLQKAKMNTYLQLGYKLEKTGKVNPYSLLTSLELNNSYQKMAVEFNYRFSYYGRKDGLDIRLFAGGMLKNSGKTSPFYALAAGGRSGREQYLYEGSYPDRFSAFPNTFWSRQMTVQEGGLVSPVNERLGYSQKLVSLSLTSSLPGFASRLAVKPFVNVVLNDHGANAEYPSLLFYEAGFKTGIWNLFEIYVPLVVSGNIQSMTGSIKDRIRIVFSLDSFSKIKLY